MADGLINIVPLSVKNLAGAIALIKKVFVYEEDRNVAYMNFIETLQGENHGQSYWVALDKQNNVIGITGLYLDDDFADKESTVWLGWFGVHCHWAVKTGQRGAVHKRPFKHYISESVYLIKDFSF